MIGNLSKLRETEHNIEVDWEIESFLSVLKSSPCSNKSPFFTWSDIEWQLQMEFNSQKEIKLFLHMNTLAKRIKVEFKLGIRMIDGTTEIRCTLMKYFNYFTIAGANFGTKEFILHPELVKRKDELLPGDILTVFCSIGHPNTLIKCAEIKYENLDVLSSNFKALYGCTKSSDITIIVREQSYLAHKAILTARSDVFAAMLKHDMEETNSGIIKVADCDSTSFGDFLLYLYTGKVENFSSDNVCHLYRMADKYNVPELKNLCVVYMERNLSTANLFDIAILANQFNEAKLTPLTQEHFNRNALEIIKEDDWKQFILQNFYIANQLLINMLEKSKASS